MENRLSVFYFDVLSAGDLTLSEPTVRILNIRLLKVTHKNQSHQYKSFYWLRNIFDLLSFFQISVLLIFVFYNSLQTRLLTTKREVLVSRQLSRPTFSFRSRTSLTIYTGSYSRRILLDPMRPKSRQYHPRHLPICLLPSITTLFIPTSHLVLSV